MGFTTLQFQRGMDYTLSTFRRTDPIDQINTERHTLAWLLKNSETNDFGNGLYENSVFMDNGSNYQPYFGADQVTFNERDPVRWAKFAYYNAHEGFFFDEDRLQANNITIDDSGAEPPTKLQKSQLVNLLGQSWRAAKQGMQQGLAIDTLLSGAQNAKSVPGLDHIVSTTPSAGTVGQLTASASWWQNNTNLGLAQAALIDGMDATWRDCIKYGGIKPNFIPCGEAFYEDYKAACIAGIGREIVSEGNTRGGVTMDGSVTRLFFKGVELIWDPMFEQLDAIVGVIAQPWTKRAYFLNTTSIKFRKVKGCWMVNRKPERLPDRYVHYFGQTTKHSMTTDQRNSMAVLSID